jgi:signal transduction histidine kinase
MRIVRAFGGRAGDVLVGALAVAALVWAAGRPHPWLVVPLAALTTLPFLFRARHPVVAALTALAALAAQSLVDNPSAQTVMALCVAMLACWVLGAVEDRAHALAGLVVAAALMLVVVAGNPGPVGLPELGFVALVTVAPFLAATVYRRGLRRATEAEAASERAVADERDRIARELHDIVGQALTVVYLQAGGARLRLAADQTDARESLEVIEQAAHEALDEMRRLVELLRAHDDPTAEPAGSLDRLDELVRRFDEWGLEVEVDRRGGPRPLPPGVDLAAYRLVQEALTNALKHGRGTARLTVAFTDAGVSVEVANPARAHHGDTGFGLIGMRERVGLYGGTLRTGLVDGVFRLEAFLPAPRPVVEHA